MKTLTVVLALLFTSILFSQSDTTLQKRFETAEYNIDLAGRLLQDASGSFQRAWLFPFVGGITTGVLIATIDKTDSGNLNFVVFIPALLGTIGGIYNYFAATGSLDDAGYMLRKSKSKK